VDVAIGVVAVVLLATYPLGAEHAWVVTAAFAVAIAVGVAVVDGRAPFVDIGVAVVVHAVTHLGRAGVDAALASLQSVLLATYPLGAVHAWVESVASP